MPGRKLEKGNPLAKLSRKKRWESSKDVPAMLFSSHGLGQWVLILSSGRLETRDHALPQDSTNLPLNTQPLPSISVPGVDGQSWTSGPMRATSSTRRYLPAMGTADSDLSWVMG
jgi:hypothetical protein